MMKIRIGNDFPFEWRIENRGEPVNIDKSQITHLMLSNNKGNPLEVKDYTIENGTLAIYVTGDIIKYTGDYNLELKYMVPDASFPNGERENTIDVDVFTIVDKTSKADDIGLVSITTDVSFWGDGKSAYELALDNGYVGTEQEWLESLNGIDGITPQKGIDYFDGIDGIDGKTPVKGVDYFDGIDGVDGTTPVKGVDYFDGENGLSIVNVNTSSSVGHIRIWLGTQAEYDAQLPSDNDLLTIII